MKVGLIVPKIIFEPDIHTETAKKVYEKFFSKYPEDLLTNWDSDVSIFSNFEENIEDSLENTIKKFQKAFW